MTWDDLKKEIDKKLEGSDEIDSVNMELKTTTELINFELFEDGSWTIWTTPI